VAILFRPVVLSFVAVLAGSPVSGAVLFPEPLHLTRAVEDPIRGETTIVEEYYIGNRVISIAGDRTAIADYERNEVTEIDRAEGTYSVTPFAVIAGATPKRMESLTTAGTDERWSILETKRADRPSLIAATPKTRSDIRKLEVAVDPSVRLSRDALDVIVGAAYPNERPAEADVYVRAAAVKRPPGSPQSNAAGAAADTYALPVEQTVTYDAGGKDFVSRNRVTRIARELPPPSLLAIPPGARQVETRRVQTRRMLDDLDTIPSAEPQP
jgi:hypothetical protein